MAVDFYCRYYVGHKGKFGHEFMEFEVQGDGKLTHCKFNMLALLDAANAPAPAMCAGAEWITITRMRP